jgi:EAL domain-containing protein (putative c-di-GMP-specific phosphodiesterase class I)
MSGGPQSGLKRVLIVDDEVALVRAHARLLARGDFQITCATSGQEAAAALATNRFDAILSDIHMPSMTGMQLLCVVRERDPDVQVVLITGRPEVRTAAAAVEFGAFQYLMKPVDGEQLRKVMSLAVDACRAARLKREFVEEFGSGVFRVGDRAGVETALDRALSSLWMAYQPIVHAGSHETFACEALMRSEERALPNPGAVLEAATRTSRLHQVGRTVRRLVASDIARDDPANILLFVNLHTEDLQDPELASPDSPLARYAPRVVLEVTERASLGRIRDVPEHITRLRELGYQIALDDLGAGYAGLSSFTQLEPDFVKLDMSLVRDVHESAIKRRLIRAMVELSHDMGKLVIAEGVETPAEQTTLEALGCDLLQGYLFARPAKGFNLEMAKVTAA